MKKKIILICLIIFIILLDTFLIIFSLNHKKEEKNNNEKENINENIKNDETIENDNNIDIIKSKKYEFDSVVYVKDILKKDIDGMLDTSSLGKKTMDINDGDKTLKIEYEVVDTKAPLILGGTTKTTTKGKKINLVNKYLCGDNHDSKPNCYIEGEYDINKVGTYNLKYVAIDSSGNKKTKNIKLKVKEKSNSSGSSSSSSTPKRTSLKKYIKKYKNKNTKIGIDVSAWQDDIDWKKAKKDGVEFAMLRIGYGHTKDNEIKLDKWFNNNIKKTKEEKIPIGVYLYSYAKTIDEAKEQAQWIVKKLNGQKLELPIAFDWENWNSFNKYKVSFKELNDIAATFIKEVENAGYEGMLYSSAYYLNQIWKQYDKTWLAYYTSNNDFKKPYNMWQLTSSGKVNGISGSVDVNVLYNDKNKH